MEKMVQHLATVAFGCWNSEKNNLRKIQRSLHL